MVWLGWSFPSYLFYSPNFHNNETVSIMLVFKKAIVLVLSLLLVMVTVVILRLKRSGNVERCLESGEMGVGVGFWLHRDLIYLLLH